MTSEQPCTPSLPSDPLAALGDLLFINVLADLPPITLAAVGVVRKSWRDILLAYKSYIWRGSCRLSGVPDWWINEQSHSDGLAGSTRDWRAICVENEVVKKNKRYGRCQQKWLHNAFPDGMTKLREFRMDAEDETIIMTMNRGGLRVVDGKTYGLLFEINTVLSGAKLDFCAGFAVIHPDEEKVTLHVYRKRSAVLRSVNKHSPAEFLPFGARDTNVYSGVFSADSALAPRFAKRNASQGRRDPEDMPHGALAFYRQINPPTRCSLFRLHEDAAHTPASRAILCAAGEGGVYVWDLDDYTAEPEIYLFPQRKPHVSHVEITDDYIFVSGYEHLHIFHRRTGQYIPAFAPDPATGAEICAMVYETDLEQGGFIEIVDSYGGIELPNQVEPARMARMNILGNTSDPECLALAKQWPNYPLGGYQFISTLSTSTDLICSTRVGELFIVRDYPSLLTISDTAERHRRWADHTINIQLGEARIAHVAVDGSFVTLFTTDKVLFFDLSTLLRLPVQSSISTGKDEGRSSLSLTLPALRLHLIIGLNELRSVTCVQIDRNAVLCSWVGIEGDHPSDHTWDMMRTSWIRGWDFGVRHQA